MMTKKRTTRLARIKLLFALPLALTMMLAISFSPDMLAQTEEKVPPPPPKKTATEEKAIQSDQEPKSIEVVEIKGEEDKPPIFTVVEDMPSFPGGKKALYAYLGDNIKYPDVAKKEGIQGTVYVTYVIEKDGSISHAKVLRGVHESLDKEAVRVIKTMPKWEPGKQRGKAVRVQYTLPIKYTLASDEEKEVKDK